jgi:hypothetical protein
MIKIDKNNGQMWLELGGGGMVFSTEAEEGKKSEL